MRCLTILAIVLAFLTHCLAQNAVAGKTARKSDSPQTKLCDLILQKLELSQRSDDKKIVIPIDNIISLLGMIKKSTSKEPGHAVESSNRELGKNNEAADNGTRRFRGRFHWRPKVSHRTASHVIQTIPEVLRVINDQREYNDPVDDHKDYLDQSYLAPSQRRLNVDPPPFVPITRSSLQLDDAQVDEEPKKADSEVKASSVKQSVGSKKRLNDVNENEKMVRSPRQQGSNDTLDVLQHLISNSDNAKVKALLKTLIANQKAGSGSDKKERTKPEVVKTVKIVDGSRKPKSKDQAKTEVTQVADKKSPSRRNKPNTKGKDIPDEVFNRLGINDDWEWDSEPLVRYVPRHVHPKWHSEDDSSNKNTNVNTNTNNRDRVPRGGSRRSYGNRMRYVDRQNVDKNTNVNSNVNGDGNEAPNILATDRFVSMRRSLDDIFEDDNSNVNTNVNTNTNTNRDRVPRNKRRGREQRRLV